MAFWCHDTQTQTKIKDRLWALEMDSYGSWRNRTQTSKTDTVLGGGRNRPEQRISAATGAGQSKMSFLRTAHASAVAIINTQPGQKFLCTQTAIRMVNDIW